jgi:hypothetical protein
MTTALVTNGNGALAIDDRALLALVTEGDCGKLTEAQKLSYYRAAVMRLDSTTGRNRSSSSSSTTSWSSTP